MKFTDEVERMARDYCVALGLDPDEEEHFGQHRFREIIAEHSVTARPMWRYAAKALINYRDRMDQEKIMSQILRSYDSL